MGKPQQLSGQVSIDGCRGGTAWSRQKTYDGGKDRARGEHAARAKHAKEKIMRSKKILFGLYVLAALVGLALSACDTGTGGGEDAQKTPPPSVQTALRKAVVERDNALLYARSNKEKNRIELTYKLGVIKNMFLQYHTGPTLIQPALTSLEFSNVYGYKQAEQTSVMSKFALNVSAKLGKKLEIGPASISDEFGASVTLEWDKTFTDSYEQTFQKSITRKYDPKYCTDGESYALASFARVGVYQVLVYNPATKTASAITDGESWWFVVESEKPTVGLYEYMEIADISFTNGFEPLDTVSVEINESDFANGLQESGYRWTTTKATNLDGVGSISRDETYSPNLPIQLLKQSGYTRLKIDVVFYYKAENLLGGGARLQVADCNKANELGRKDWTNLIFDTAWHDQSFSVTVGIDATRSGTGQFMLLWSKTGISDYCIGLRTVTITALK
jgi:predicted small secreted protein